MMSEFVFINGVAVSCLCRPRGNCTNSFLVKIDGKGEIYPNPQST